MIALTQPACRMFYFEHNGKGGNTYTVLFPIFAIEASEDVETCALYIDGHERIGRSTSNLMTAPWPADDDKWQMFNHFNRWCFAHDYIMREETDEPETPTP